MQSIGLFRPVSREGRGWTSLSARRFTYSHKIKFQKCSFYRRVKEATLLSPALPPPPPPPKKNDPGYRPGAIPFEMNTPSSKVSEYCDGGGGDFQMY